MVDTNFGVLLQDHLRKKFGIGIDRIGRSWFKLPSGAIIYVNGSKLLVTQGDSCGWYDLGFKEYEKLIMNSNYYYVLILDKPELTFILPPDKVKAIFSEVRPESDNEWHYKVRNKNSHYILKPSNDQRSIGNIHYIEDFLNKWTQIDDFKKIYQQTNTVIDTNQKDKNETLDQQAKPILNFIDLQIFLLEEMRMQANYQPIMIMTLLSSGGKVTKDDITAKIKELNPEKKDLDFKNIPVYSVLENRGIVKEDGNEFILNIGELTEEQRHQLIALCKWKIYNMPSPLEELIEAFDKNRNLFDPDGPPLDELEKLRSAFVYTFPVEKILQLELDEYVAGADPKTEGINKSTFCYRLEHELGKLGGFGVRTALDFGIYYNQENQEYLYNNKDKYGSPQEAFDVIKSEIYHILEAGEQYYIDHNLDALIQSLERNYNISRNIMSKILSVYYPEDFVQIHTLEMVETILQSFGKTIENMHNRFFVAQGQILEIKNSHPIMKQWHNNDYSYFLWRAIIKRNVGITESKKEDNKQLQNKERMIFVTAYDNSNLNRSKQVGILGWKSNSKLLSSGDYVFVFNKSTLNIDSCFKIKSKSNNIETIWSDELESGQLIYKNRWNAELIAENLGIPLKIINDTPHFNKESFQLRLKANFPMPLNSPALDSKYITLCDILLNKISYTLSEKSGKDVEQEKLEIKNWHLLTSEDIDEIVYDVLQGNRSEKERTLAIARETIRRIITHLISSKHVILVGPPGTGKTDLARRLLRELSKRIIGKKTSPMEAVASYEWGRYEVIGGNSLKTDREQNNNFIFHLGCVTKAIKDGKLLLIDEFNRSDMNKAFGEMFLAIDHGTIQLREDEKPDFNLSLLYDNLKNSIRIPEEFRMICTMNDYDKSLLNELSYGLLRRFAFVEIDAPTKDEEMHVVKERLKENNLGSFNKLVTDKVINIISPQLDKFLDFMVETRNKRKLGVSTSIDVAKYMAVGYALSSAEDNNDKQWKLLNEALVDYVLPQLDRLDQSTLEYVKEAAYNTLLDENGKVPNSIKTGFISKLESMISDLDSINRLFVTPTSSEEI